MAVRHMSASLFYICMVASLFAVSVSQPAPKIQLDKKVTKLYQYETSSSTLFRVACVTVPPGKGCTVRTRNIQPSNPCGKCFVVLPGCYSGSDDYCVRYLPGQGFLNPSVEPQYLIILEAEDADGGLSQDLMDVRVTINAPPYFDYGAMSVTQTINNAESVLAGTLLATVAAIDDDNDPVTFFMSTVPKVDDIVIDSLSGGIRTEADLRSLCVNAVCCVVTVQDDYNSPVGPFLLNLDFQDANNPPVITNLNTELFVLEDEPVDSTILSVAVFDDNVYPDIAFSFTAVPSSMLDYFYFTGNKLQVKQALDYETLSRVTTMSIQATDGYCASETYTLTIRIVDINERPILLPIDQTVETCEGLVDIIPTWTASDPDEGDSWTFTDVQPNTFGRFKIHGKSGVVSTTIDYDLDEAKHPSSVSLIVTLSDQQLYTATASLTVLFVDCNDNPPVFSRASKEVSVTPCDPVGTVLSGIPKATDADSDYRQNNVITYSGSGGMASVDEAGSIIVERVFTQGQYVTFPVYATDKGEVPGPLTSKNALWVSVYAQACPTTNPPQTTAPPDVTTTNPTPTTPDNSADGWGANEAWIIIAILTSCLLVALALFMFWRYGWARCRQSCRGSNRQSSKVAGGRPRGKGEKHVQWTESQEMGRINPARRPSPTPQKTHPGFLFAWWKERYTDADYDKMPDRHALPEPSKGLEPSDPHTYDNDEPVVGPPPPPPPSPPPTPPPPPPPPPAKKRCVIL